jgi:hypothetical protein
MCYTFAFVSWGIKNSLDVCICVQTIVFVVVMASLAIVRGFQSTELYAQSFVFL